MSHLVSEGAKQRNRDRAKKWREEHYDRYCAGLKRHYQEHKEERLAYQRDLYNRKRSERILTDARRRAKKLGLPFNLTIDDIIIPNLCPVLGILIEMNPGGNGYNNPNSPSLDRLIPSLGYVKGNVFVISWRANALKKDATIGELERVIEYMRK